MSKRLSPTQQRTAYHEAAHAVAAHLHGWEIICVQASHLPAKKMKRHARGTVYYTGHYTKPQDPDNWLRVTLASGDAERRLCRERGWKLDESVSSWEPSDWYQVVRYFYSRRPEGTTKIASEDAQRIIAAQRWAARFAQDAANWRAIVVVAEAALDFLRRDQFAYLLGDDVHAMIAEALKEPAA